MVCDLRNGLGVFQRAHHRLSGGLSRLAPPPLGETHRWCHPIKPIRTTPTQSGFRVVVYDVYHLCRFAHDWLTAAPLDKTT